jgi:hypothetical protein
MYGHSVLEDELADRFEREPPRRSVRFEEPQQPRREMEDRRRGGYPRMREPEREPADRRDPRMREYEVYDRRDAPLTREEYDRRDAPLTREEYERLEYARRMDEYELYAAARGYRMPDYEERIYRGKGGGKGDRLADDVWLQDLPAFKGGKGQHARAPQQGKGKTTTAKSRLHPRLREGKWAQRAPLVSPDAYMQKLIESREGEMFG